MLVPNRYEVNLDDVGAGHAPVSHRTGSVKAKHLIMRGQEAATATPLSARLAEDVRGTAISPRGLGVTIENQRLVKLS